MKLNRQKMLDLIETIEADVDQRGKEWTEAEKAFRVQERKQWIEKYHPQLRAVRDLLSAKLKSGAVLTEEEIAPLVSGNRRWSSHPTLPVFAPTSMGFNYKGKEYPATKPLLDQSPLLDLKAALQSIADEEVSTSALAAMGFRNLEWFWRRVKEAQA
ncbi:hypothetical protein BI081_gp132 [Mycobacterium phage Tonenili]|uniref:Uncharacterized protein n=1 Tax=Mycobacterium phage Tonenili TaxID=1891703 RepID=A0A1C9EHK5_9CAUD|nr:hypothetical protein BI081_gp132 [Mycobacterium phage Tonenili]AON96975.1 hypothetical protein SEA_TONENILI_257 [Mycobacterium phage Tonenili]